MSKGQKPSQELSRSCQQKFLASLTDLIAQEPSQDSEATQSMGSQSTWIVEEDYRETTP